MSKEIESVENFIFDDDVQNMLSEINNQVMDFNILEITGMGNQEIKHSNILGWLFSDAEHNLEYQILNGFLKKVVEISPNNNLQKYIYLSDEKQEIIIYREKDNIDLLIIDEANKVVITIENKVYANESETQLEDYENTINNKYSEYKRYFIFLTINLEKPSRENWLRANHQMITDIIKKILVKKEITLKTKIILESYIDLLKRNSIVEDQKLKELCKQIWANKKYRDALNILYINEPTNYKLISNLIINKLKEIDAKYDLYAHKDNDILFKTKSIKTELYENGHIQFNLSFDYGGIILALYIDTEEDKFKVFHEELFPKKNKINNRNQIIKISKKWNDYIDDIGNINLEDDIKEDIDAIFNKIELFDNKISKIKL